MLFKWLDSRQATEVGTALADDFVLYSGEGSTKARPRAGSAGDPAQKLQKFLQRFLQQIDREARSLPLNVFKRAKLANSFKWRLLEKGVDKALVEELTGALVQRLTGNGHGTAAGEGRATQGRRDRRDVQSLMMEGNEHVSRGEFDRAASCYEDVVLLDPRNAAAHNNLGVALNRLGRYQEAWQEFRRALGIKPTFADAHFNLGTLQRSLGRFDESEQPLRRALKLKPGFTDARVSLAATLFLLGNLDEARELLEGALRVAPRDGRALETMGQLVARQGHFADAESWFRRALEVDPMASHAWVGLAGLRRLTAEDSDWLKGAQRCADSGLPAVLEANVRYAIGRYYDEVGEFASAFRSFQRANELVKIEGDAYSPDDRTRFADDLIRTYSGEVISGSPSGASTSMLPVFVVGMPRSGTTLMAQIIDSHPAAASAGELRFWSHTLGKHLTRLRHEAPNEATRRQLAAKYLRVLTEQFPQAERVVDKSPFNSDMLGLIHMVFPKARFIYVRRDAVDTCLSCYFQDFPPSLRFTHDLGALAHYYREHRRLIEHWRSALPAGALLEVPYEALIADQATWTRRIIEFLGLPWDERCLEFHRSTRPVLTASYWQVRQKLYSSSVGRWRNYKKFIGPLLELEGLS